MGRTILSFGAHPDDIEIGCGGTEIKLIRQGYSATHVMITSGDAGSSSISREELASIRESEAREAARALSVSGVEFLRAPDGLTGFTREMKVEVIDLIRKYRPDIVFVHSEFDMFPDHRIVFSLVMAALAGAAGPWYQESKREPHSPGLVLGYEVWHPLQSHQLAVDITDTMEIKLSALRCHKSQVGPTRYDEAFQGLARYRGVMSFSGSYAEVFQVIKTTESFCPL